MSGYRNEIANFLRSKGLNDYAVAGFLGNFMVESGFNPDSSNSAEGAIGFANWEGGRRTALQQWAMTHYGAQETDAMSQLTFLWHELTTSYSGVLDQLKHVTSAGQAAAIIDAQYEVSSGAARQQRINYANQFYSGAGPNPPYTGPSGGNTGDAGTGGGSPNRNYEGVDSLGKLLSQIPQLKKLVDEAQANNWSIEKFKNAVEDSEWWKNHSDTARAVIIQRANDPASWQQTLTNTESSISALAKQLGMSLTDAEVQGIAHNALLTGNGGNQQWITSAISRHEDYSDAKNLNNLQGGMAATAQQLQQMAADYGFHWTAAQTAMHAQDVLDGTTTIDTYRQRLMTWAESAFPSLAKQIQGGTTVKDLADPYVQSMSNLLEIDPGKLDVYNPMIRQALQGSVPPGGKDGQVQATPLWKFEQQVREDPRWAMTQNAHDTMSSALVRIGADFGFGPEG